MLRRRGHIVDSIVLTEHRKFDIDADYSALAREYEVLVLRGSELDTRYGHFLVYGVTDELLGEINFADVTMDPMRLMQAASEHGAIAVPAHPGRPGIGLCGFTRRGVEFPQVRIVETLNGGSRKGENEEAQELAHKMDYLGIGGSDAHLTSSIATCLTRFEAGIESEQDLVDALLSGRFSPVRLEDTCPDGIVGSEQGGTP